MEIRTQIIYVQKLNPLRDICRVCPYNPFEFVCAVSFFLILFSFFSICCSEYSKTIKLRDKSEREYDGLKITSIY